MKCFIFIFALFLSLSLIQAQSFFAAKCLAQTPYCRNKTARKSIVCFRKVDFAEQSEECIKSACEYCMVGRRRRKFPCKKRILRQTCQYDTSATSPLLPTSTPSTSSSIMYSMSISSSPSNSPSSTISPSVSMVPSSSLPPSLLISVSPSVSQSTSPSSSTSGELILPTISPSTSVILEASQSTSPSPSPSLSPSSSPSSSPSYSPSYSTSSSPSFSPPVRDPPEFQGCYWPSTDDTIVIPLSSAPETEYWTPVTRDGLDGLIYAKDKEKGIDRPGRKGVMCFDTLPATDGKYYFTALSYAPNSRDHNDVWVRSSNGFELWKFGTEYERPIPPTEWRKAYQNFGTKGISQDFKSVDNNGYRFLIPNVKAGQKLEICLSGRSSKYELYRLILIKCEGKFCTGAVDRTVKDRPLTMQKCE